LVAACREGRAWAWDALVDRYKRLIYSIPLRAGLSADDAADVFQTVFARLVEHLHAIRDPQALAAWLITTAKRESWSVSQRRRRVVDETEMTVELAERASQLLGEHPGEDRWAVRALVRDSLEKMDGRCKELLLLLYWDEHEPSYEEISKRLSLPLGSIGPTRSRCLQKMRRIFEAVSW